MQIMYNLIDDIYLPFAMKRIRKNFSLKGILRSKHLDEIEELRLREALTAAELGIWNLDTKTSLYMSDARFKVIFGTTVKGLNEKEAIANIHPGDRKRAQKAVTAATRPHNPAVYDIEYRVIHPNLSIHWVAAKGSATFKKTDAGLKIQSFAGTVADITHRKEAEADLLKNQKDLQTAKENLYNLFMHAPAIVAVIRGPDLVFEIANPQYRQMVGVDRLLDGVPLMVALPDLEQSMLETVKNVAIKGIRFQANELPVLLDWDKSGTAYTKYVNLVFEPLFDNNKKPNGLMFFGHDVTEQVSNRLRLEENVRYKEEFVSMASHELRTPVTSIKGYAQLLELHFLEAGDTYSAGLLLKLDQQVDNLTHLISDLFDDTRVKEGKLELHQDYFDLNLLCADAINEVQHTTKKHVITSTFGTLPLVFGDHSRIRQVVINLLTNAVKYSPNAKLIKFKTKLTGKNVTISIQDYGIGISKEEQARIFTRFYRVRSKDLDTYPGLGLGLFIATEMIDRHGGNLKVKSVLGKGSVFSIMLPVKKTEPNV